jgi:hypothetical protein
MSRYLFSNNKKIANQFASHCESVGFSHLKKIVCGEGSECNQTIFGVSTKKTMILDENTLQTNNGVVVVVGTCFYKGVLSTNVLQDILDDYLHNRNIESLRKNMVGTFAVAIGVGDEMTFFTDENGIQYLYLYNDKESGSWIVSTSLYEMAKTLKGKLTISENCFVENIFTTSTLCGETEFNEIQKLSGQDIVQVNSAGVVNVKKLSNELKLDTRPLPQIINSATDEARRLARMVNDNFGNSVALCMTGGLDARIVFASLLSEHIKPSLYYGIGNSQLTNTYMGDWEVNQIYANRFNLSLTKMDWSTPDNVTAEWDKYIEKYGMMAKTYSASPAVMQSYEGIKERIVFLGFYGELYRNLPYVENSSNDAFTIDQLINNYLIEGDIRHVIGRQKYDLFLIHLRSQLAKLLKPFLTSDGLLPRDLFIALERSKRFNNDSLQINLLNQQRYCFAFLGEPSLLKFTAIPVQEKMKSQLSIQLAYSIKPEVLEVPIFSRFTWKEYDAASGTVVNRNQQVKQGWISHLKNTNFGRYVRRQLRPFISEFRNKEKKNTLSNMIIGRQLEEVIKDNQIFNHEIDARRSEYISKEARYAMTLLMFHKLGIKSI